MGNCMVVSSSSDERRDRGLAAAAESACERILPFATRSHLAAEYELGRELGRGQSGVIRACKPHQHRHRHGVGVGVEALLACKSISKTSGLDAASIVREVEIMAHISAHLRSPTSPNPNPNPNAPNPNPNPNPNAPDDGDSGPDFEPGIVRLHDVIEDPDSVHLIIDLCPGGDLFELVARRRRLPERAAARLLASLLRSVLLCHRLGVMHRDLKPENILLLRPNPDSDSDPDPDSDSLPIKLADFGLALRFRPGQKFSGMVGSSYYMAPEVFHGEYDERIDVWSCGVILYVLLCGFPPFGGPTQQAIFNAIQRGKLCFPSLHWDAISSSAKDLVSRLLRPDPSSRLTIPQALNHPWILGHTSPAPSAASAFR